MVDVPLPESCVKLPGNSVGRMRRLGQAYEYINHGSLLDAGA